MIWLTRSILRCIARKAGTIRTTISETMMSSTGTETAMSQDSPTSCWMAKITPPIARIGADTMRVAETCTSSCTCWTSLVLRVMSDGAPNCPTSRCEKPTTRWNSAERRSRPMPIASREPKYTAATEHTTWARLIRSITPPVRQM